MIAEPRERRAQEADCPSFHDHTPSPPGYNQWHAWARKMKRTHRQIKCTGCGLLQIWEPRAVEPFHSSQKGDDMTKHPDPPCRACGVHTVTYLVFYTPGEGWMTACRNKKCSAYHSDDTEPQPGTTKREARDRYRAGLNADGSPKKPQAG